MPRAGPSWARPCWRGREGAHCYQGCSSFGGQAELRAFGIEGLAWDFEPGVAWVAAGPTEERATEERPKEPVEHQVKATGPTEAVRAWAFVQASVGAAAEA